MDLINVTYNKLPKSIKRRIVHLYRYLPSSKKTVIKEIDGVKFELDLSRLTHAQLYHYGVYEPGTTNTIKQFVKEGMICFDIGASSGVHALRMAKQVGKTGRVYAFEPSNWMFEKLQRNLSLNDDLKHNHSVILEKMGLSDKVTKEKFLTTEHGKIGRDIDEPEIEISLTTIDDYIKLQCIKKVDFIKIDTDGHEVKILEGGVKCLREHHPVMSIEFRPSLCRDLIGLLTVFGYHFYNEITLQRFSVPELVDFIDKEVTNVLCR